jgi:hypothetical protein
MNREGPYVMASEDFSYMLEKVPGAFINIGNGGGEGGCEVHNPATTSTTRSSPSARRCGHAWWRPSWRRTRGDQRLRRRHWLLRDLPYAVMLALAVGGLVLTSFRGTPTHYYWMALAPIYGLISVISGWKHIDTNAGRMQLVWTQALHWLAFLAAMWLMFLPEVRGVRQRQCHRPRAPHPAGARHFRGRGARPGLAHLCGRRLSCRCRAGGGWVQESAMLILVSVLLLAVVGAAFWWMWHRERGRP